MSLKHDRAPSPNSVAVDQSPVKMTKLFNKLASVDSLDDSLNEFLDSSLAELYGTVEREGTSVKATEYTHSTSNEDVATSNVSTAADPTTESDVTASNAPMASGAMADFASSNNVTSSDVDTERSSDDPVPESPDRIYTLVVG